MLVYCLTKKVRMTAVKEFLTGAPIWVYFLLFYLVSKGIKALKSHTVPYKKLFYLPILFACFSFYSLSTTVYSLNLALFFYGIFLIFGMILGYLLVKRMTIQIDQEKNLFKLPGTPLTLILILSMFLLKYLSNYLIAVNPLIKTQALFNGFYFGISGLGTGLLLGRLIRYFKLKRQLPHTELSEAL